MKVVPLGFILCFAYIGFTQTDPDKANIINMSNKDWNNVLYGGQPFVTHNVRKVRGTPFVYDQYLKGAVILSDSLLSPEYLFKLNVHNNEIWLKKTDGTEIILTSPRLAGLILYKDGLKHIYKRLALPSITTPTRKFVEIFYCGSFTLVKEIQKRFSSADDTGTKVLNGEDEDVFDTKELYYLTDESGSLKRLKLKLDDLLESYPDFVKKHRSAFDAYCKSKSIGKNLSESQVTELLKFMNELRNR